MCYRCNVHIYLISFLRTTPFIQKCLLYHRRRSRGWRVGRGGLGAGEAAGARPPPNNFENGLCPPPPPTPAPHNPVNTKVWPPILKIFLRQCICRQSFLFRPKQYICVFQVSALKKLGMVGRHNILFYQNILYRNFTHFLPFFSKFDLILLTIHNKMFRVGAKT